jgi:hypothetical protein
MILLSQGSGMMSNESITSILELLTYKMIKHIRKFPSPHLAQKSLTMHSVQQHASIHMQKALPVSPYFPACKKDTKLTVNDKGISDNKFLVSFMCEVEGSSICTLKHLLS